MSEKFQIGDVIHHKRYDYRGAIFQRDLTCQADAGWYQSNQTQPDRNQPWYHVMVDGSEHTTYVAEEHLELDQAGKPVNHPMLEKVFITFFEGRYYKDSLN